MRRKTYERNRGFTSGVTLTGRRKPMSMSIKVEDGKTIQVSRKGELKFKSNFGDHKVGFLFHTYYENGEKTFDDLEWTYGELTQEQLTKLGSRGKAARSLAPKLLKEMGIKR